MTVIYIGCALIVFVIFPWIFHKRKYSQWLKNSSEFIESKLNKKLKVMPPESVQNLKAALGLNLIFNRSSNIKLSNFAFQVKGADTALFLGCWVDSETRGFGIFFQNDNSHLPKFEISKGYSRGEKRQDIALLKNFPGRDGYIIRVLSEPSDLRLIEPIARSIIEKGIQHVESFGCGVVIFDISTSDNRGERIEVLLSIAEEIESN